MASLTMINTTNPSDTRMGSTTCYLVSTASSNCMSSLSGSGSTRLTPKQQQRKLSSESMHQNLDLMRTKRRIHLGHINSCHTGSGIQQTAAVARRNERERNRVRLVNMGFATLRQHVPHGTKNKKMSKVDTLRSAVEYIKQLQELLQEQDSSAGCPSSLRSRDENSYPSSMSYDSTGSVQSTNSVTSPAGSGASSPTPSLCSDPSSPLDLLNAEEDELIDFTSWF